MTNTKGLKEFRHNSGLRIACVKFTEEVFEYLFTCGNPLYAAKLAKVIQKAGKNNFDREFDQETITALTLAFAIRVGRVGDEDVFEMAWGVMSMMKVLDMVHSPRKGTIPPA